MTSARRMTAVVVGILAILILGGVARAEVSIPLILRADAGLSSRPQQQLRIQ